MAAVKIIEARTKFTGEYGEHPYLVGYEVVVVAVLKDALIKEDGGYLKSDEDIEAAGGVVPERDRVEVAPVLKGGTVSFVTSDARASDLEMLRSPT